jgi:hypothetical protein
VGWPLLTVETEANGESWRTRERVPSMVGSFGTICNSSFFAFLFGSNPETREGWPLLTVETETNGDSWSIVHMKGSFLDWFIWHNL